MTVQHIADLEPARRTAILVVQAASLETRLSDATLAMFEKYMGALFSRARNRDERRFLGAYWSDRRLRLVRDQSRKFVSTPT